MRPEATASAYSRTRCAIATASAPGLIKRSVSSFSSGAPRSSTRWDMSKHIAGRPGSRRRLRAGNGPQGLELASTRAMVGRLPGTPMPPLQLTDDEMTVLRRLAEPIDHQRRPQFLQEVAAELEAKRQAGEIGEGVVHRVARTLQRKYWEPPEFPNAAGRARA